MTGVMNRRQFLALAGASVATTSAGCTLFEGEPDTDADRDRTPGGDATPTDARVRERTPSPSESPIPHADQFETVVDMAEAGADTGGDSSVVYLLEAALGDETLVYFPPGRYLLDEPIQFLDFENLGIVGRDAVLVPPEGHDRIFFDLGRPGRASGLLFEGISFDFRAPDTGARPLSALVDDRLVVRGLEVTGRQDAGDGMLRVDVTDPEGSGLVEGLTLPDGAAYGTESNGCLVGDEHRGEVRFEDCHIERFPDNGLYADPTEGSVEVVGGYFANCEVSCVRVGNDSLVRDVHVRCDTAPPEYGNMRGIRLTNSDGAVVENCRVEFEQVAGSDGAVALGSDLVSATVRDTDIRVDADGIHAVRVKPPKEGVPRDGEIALENVAISGSASGSHAVEVGNRDECNITDITVEQRGDDRNGLYFNTGTSASVENSRIDVTARPVVAEDGARVRISNSHPARINNTTRGL